MHEQDRQAFGEMLLRTLRYYEKEPAPDIIQVWWSLLQQYPLQAIRQAFQQHMETSKFAPKASEIRDIILDGDGRPQPNEAYALLKWDEASTNVWTQEMAAAFFIALPMEDENARRMAFREHYTRAVADARRNGVPVQWAVSLGHDRQGREITIRQAVDDGRLTLERGQQYLPDLTESPADKPQQINRRAEVKKLAAAIGS